MPKPLVYRWAAPGFGIWRIAYDLASQTWILAYSASARGEQWIAAGEHHFAEDAALAVGERKTGVRIWDSLCFAQPGSAELRNWKVEDTDGVQPDAPD